MDPTTLTIRQADFAAAVRTALQHISISREVSQNSLGFAIVDNGKRYGVYNRQDFHRGQCLSGLFRPRQTLGELVATVDMCGLVTME